MLSNKPSQTASNQEITSKNFFKNLSSPSNQIQPKYSQINSKKNFPQQQQFHQYYQPPEIKRETHIGQIKIKTYFAFNQTCFENNDDLIKKLILEFNLKLDELINAIHLTLALREIHETKKWNNLLLLSENTTKQDVKTLSGEENVGEDLNRSITSSNTLNSKDIDDTFSPQSTEEPNGQNRNSLKCDRVWSILFKLHRLHQTKMIKAHGTAELTPSSTSILSSLHHQSQQQQQQQQQSQQQTTSQGLKKLQEFLVNFRIEEASCEDLYVYTKNNEIFLLKLEEVYETNASSANAASIVSSLDPQANQNPIMDQSVNSSLNANENLQSVNESSARRIHHR